MRRAPRSLTRKERHDLIPRRHFAWLHDWSLYSWAYAEAPLMNGWVGPLWLPFVVSAILLLAGWLVFRRRDVAV